MALLEVNNLRTSFFTDAGEVKAVNDVSFTLDRGKVLGIVGESGSGKSVTAYSIMQILAGTGKIVGGSIKFDGTELVGAGEKVMLRVIGQACEQADPVDAGAVCRLEATVLTLLAGYVVCACQPVSLSLIGELEACEGEARAHHAGDKCVFA